MYQLTNWIKSHQVIACFVITFAITGVLQIRSADRAEVRE